MISLSELPSLLDDRQPSDVCIGVPSNQGNLLRVLLRQRLTMLTAVDRAGELAEQLAGEHDETVLSRDLQPSAVHVVAASDGCQIWLDYDLGLRTHRHPKVVRRLTLLLWIRPDPNLMLSETPSTHSRSSEPRVEAELSALDQHRDE